MTSPVLPFLCTFKLQFLYPFVHVYILSCGKKGEQKMIDDRNDSDRQTSFDKKKAFSLCQEFNKNVAKLWTEQVLDQTLRRWIL